MSFLPENYQEPATGRYAKLEEGKNKFRILGSSDDQTVLTGTVLWVTIPDGSRKPMRRPLGDSHPVELIGINEKTGEPDVPKVFWCFPVWSYKNNQVELLEISQKTIREAIRALSEDEDWGDPRDYDITINRIEEGGKTSYSVTPQPKKPVADEIKAAYVALPLNLKALYVSETYPYGGDPFAAKPSDVPNTTDKIKLEDIDL